MQLNDTNKEYLVSEFQAAHSGMSNATSAESVMYYFSATYGTVGRVINFEYDEFLVYAHVVLQNAYNMIQLRLRSIPNDPAVAIPNELFEKLTEDVYDIASAIDDLDAERMQNALVRIANMAFSTTGNGYYLYLQGKNPYLHQE